MTIDIAYQLGAVKRSVSSVEVDGKSARAVTLVRDYPTSMDDLWDALTNVERIPRWFMPISGDLKLGGHYQFEGNAGGKIAQCDEPSYLSVTWEWQGDISWLELRLKMRGENACQLSLVHTAMVTDFWAEFGPGATGIGWELGLVGLEFNVIEPNAPKMDEEQFASSSTGKAYMTQSSELWGEASIAAGTNKADALAAAKRTTAFYTGEVPENT